MFVYLYINAHDLKELSVSSTRPILKRMKVSELEKQMKAGSIIAAPMSKSGIQLEDT
jgi:hypothetical protein